MALLTWSDKYSVGVKAIDAQHANLVGILNDLHDAMMKGQAAEITAALLKKLVTYTREHFAAEEAMMTAAKYPALKEHIAKHRDLTKEVEAYVGRFERGEAAINTPLLNFLRDWLSNHILKEDKGYGPFLNKNGIR